MDIASIIIHCNSDTIYKFMSDKKNHLTKIDIGRCLVTVRPALWPGDVEYDLSYAAEVQPTPNN